MFKSFSDSSRNKEFHGFPNLNFQMNNEAYGFSGCTFWLDAAYGLNTQTDLDDVNSWKDRIRNIEFNQQTAASQPRLILSNANFNNKPTVQATSTARTLLSQSGADMDSNKTIAVIAKINTSTNSSPVIGTSTTVNTNILLGGTNANALGIGIYDAEGATGATLITSTVEDASAHISVLNANRIIVDGVQVATGSALVPTTQMNRLFGSGTFSRGLIGDIAEVIIFNYLFNENECIELSYNLNIKYALY
jgi:hypothetical protein